MSRRNFLRNTAALAAVVGIGTSQIDNLGKLIPDQLLGKEANSRKVSAELHGRSLEQRQDGTPEYFLKMKVEGDTVTRNYRVPKETYNLFNDNERAAVRCSFDKEGALVIERVN